MAVRTGDGRAERSRGPAQRIAQSVLSGEWAVYAATAVLTAVVVWFALDLYNMQWSIPLNYEGDAVLIAAHIKTDIETGWYESQSLLGAPFGQVYHDWKSADNLHHIFASVVGLVVKDFGVVMNLYYLLGYLFAALAGAWFLRLVGVSRALTAVLAVLFAIAPYHFFRAEFHLWLSSYYPIPLALGVVYLIARGLPIWTRSTRYSNRVLGWLTGRAAFTTVALALVATGNSYYGFWTALFIAFVGLGRLVYDRSWRRFVAAVAAGAWTVVVMLVNMAPDLLYSAANGANAAAVSRYPVESEVYSLKLIQLILPQSGHRIGFLNTLRQFYESTFPYSVQSPALGVVGAFGFVAALAIVAYAVLFFGTRRATSSPTLRSLGVLGGLILFAFLLSTFGGLSSLIALFTSDLRGWNRMVIELAILSLAVTGLILDAAIRFATRRIRSTTVVRAVSIATGGLLLVVGYVDQVTPVNVPNYAAAKAAFQQDEDMVTAIEEIVPADSMILQLPFRLFPESASDQGVWDTDQLLPYLHSDTLRWSGGGIKGRPASMWSSVAESELSTRAVVLSATAAGFGGVLFDRKSYGPEEAPGVEAELIATLGEPSYRSPDDRYAFYSTADARSVLDGLSPAEAESIGDAVVNPVLVSFEPNYLLGYSVVGSVEPYEPRFVAVNPRDETVSVDITVDLSYRQGGAMLSISLPGGRTERVDVGPESTTVTFSVDVPSGSTDFAVAVVEGSQPDKATFGDSGPIGVGGISVVDSELVDELSAIPGLEVLRRAESD